MKLLTREQIEKKKKFKTSYIKDSNGETMLKCCINTDKGKLCMEGREQILYWEDFQVNEVVRDILLEEYDKKNIIIKK